MLYFLLSYFIISINILLKALNLKYIYKKVMLLFSDAVTVFDDKLCSKIEEKRYLLKTYA